MLSVADDAQTDNDKPLTSWEARNRKYIQQLIMQKKQAQLQSQQAAEQEQKLKAKLARRVLGASFQRLYPQQAAALSRSLDHGGSNSASDSDVGGGSGPGSGSEHGPGPKQLERCDTHSQIPRLPPLADASDAAGPADGAAAAAGSMCADGAASGLRQEPADCAAGSGGGNVRHTPPHTLQGRISGTLRRHPNPNPNPLSRSVSEGQQRTGAPLHSSQYSVDGAGGGGGAGFRRSLQQHQLQQQGQSQRFRNHRRRRSTGPDPPMKPVREAATASGDDDGGGGGGDGDDDYGDDGPDVAVSDRRASRRDKALRPQPHTTQPQAPVLAVAARSSSRLTAASGLPPTPSSYALWRSRARLPEGQRTFCIAGTGNHSQGIRAGLLARGWYENPDRNSPFFDFKWAANPLDIDHQTLWPGQIVNHFRHSTCLTTKHGLCYTVRDTVWYEAADAAAFYPRAYDITDETSRREFLQDVRWTAAESLIKRALIDGAICTAQAPYSPRSPRRKSSSHNSQHQNHHPQQHTQQGRVSQALPATATATADTPGGGVGTSEASDASPSGGGDETGDGAVGTLPPEEAGSAGGGGSVGGGGEVHRLQQRSDSTPLVDLPSLRLACRVVAARLRHQRHLRVVHGGGGGGGGGGGRGRGGSGGGRGDPDEPPPGVELSTAQWQQLVKHRALSCSAPVLPPPHFDPSWITSRTFITSAMLPQSTSTALQQQSGKSGGGGGARRSPVSRKSTGGGAARKGRGPQGQHRHGGGGGGGAGTGTDGEAGSGSDSGDSGESEGGEGGQLAPSASCLAAEAGDDQAAAAAAEAPTRNKGPVVVVDAAELLREVYGKARRRHSAPPPQRREGASSLSPSSGPSGPSGTSNADDGGELQAPLSASLASSSSLQLAAAAATVAPTTSIDTDSAGDATNANAGRGGGADGDADGDVDATGAASWLPEDLPAVCYDDGALQALDFTSWRGAAEAILGALEGTAVQTHISGTNNIWIVKPAGKSRGRGIRLFNDPDALLSYVRGEEAQGLESRWIAQKYVERPLIIARRKFDIRQWVLVTDWNPLQAWFYSTCYLRFAADDYNPNNLDVFQHLTNNSVSKNYEGPKKEDEITASGNMWSIPRFQQWLSEVYGRDDIWPALLQPAMRHIAICTLKSAQDHISPRKGSCQLYGYDFLIDDQLRVWLLEVNSSPTMEPSTPVTAQLCADVQEDILKVVVDLPEQQAARRQARAGGGSEAAAAGDVGGGGSDLGVTPAAAATGGPAGGFDTGQWECIIDGGEELRQPQYTGLNLELKGTAIHIPQPRSNFAGRLYAATRQQQHHHHQQSQQQQSSVTVQEDSPCSSSGGGGSGGVSSGGGSTAEGTVTGGGRRPGLGVSGAGTAGAATAAASPGPTSASAPSRGATPLSSSAISSGAEALDQGERQQLQPHHNQQTVGPHGADGEDELAGSVSFGGGGGFSRGAGAAMVARAYSGFMTPPSRGGRASPVRCRTPRISASPALSTHWDSGGFVFGSFGDPMGAITSVGSSSPAHAPSRTMTPRSDAATAALFVGAPPAAAAAGAIAGAASTPAPISVAASALWMPMSPSRSLDFLTPKTMRMSLLARPGHQAGASGLGPTGVRAR